MSEEFEWFDPFEQRALAQRETQRANGAYQAGHDAAQRVLERAVRAGLPKKLEDATGYMAEKIARKVVYGVAARMSYDPVSSNFGPAVAAAFKQSCDDILGAVTKWPNATRVRARIDAPSPWTETETMTMEFEIIEPVRVAVRIEL